jgi:2-amino-4-hydroxy-6-hydroxymethyldihydropteridine diphosphokinase
MPEFAIGMGSNLKDRMNNLQEGLRFLLSRFGMGSFQLSAVYETPPIEDAQGDKFLNSVLVGTYYGPVEDLHGECREAEILLGSVTRKRGGARTLDLDILFFEGCVRDDDLLKLPHPRLHTRKFVLKPLAEVWQSNIPGLDSTPEQLLERCADNSKMKKICEVPPRGCFWEVLN